MPMSLDVVYVIALIAVSVVAFMLSVRTLRLGGSLMVVGGVQMVVALIAAFALHEQMVAYGVMIGTTVLVAALIFVLGFVIAFVMTFLFTAAGSLVAFLFLLGAPLGVLSFRQQLMMEGMRMSTDGVDKISADKLAHMDPAVKERLFGKPGVKTSLATEHLH